MEVLVLENEGGIGQGSSSRNSEVIHAGLHYKPGSLKARLCVTGRHALYQYCAERGVPHKRCGKLVVATTPNEDAALDSLKQRAGKNGVEEIALIGAARLKELEPHLHGSSALVSGTTGMIDGHALMLAYRGDAEAAGCVISLRTPLLESAIAGDTPSSCAPVEPNQPSSKPVWWSALPVSMPGTSLPV